MVTVDNFAIAFTIYAFLGWVCEEFYCSIPAKRFVNRGFLYGPFLPIYGFGSMIVLLLLMPFRDKWYLVYLAGAFLCSCLEYFTHYMMEKLFKVKLWDYSSHRFNLNGRVSLKNSSLFGIGCLAIVYITAEPIYRLIDAIPSWAVHPISEVISAAFAVDTTLSVIKLNAFRKAMVELKDISLEFGDKVTKLSGEAAERLKASTERRRQIALSKMRGVIRNNPSMRYGNKRLDAELLKAKLMIEEKRGEFKKLKAELKSEFRRKTEGYQND